MYKIVAAVNSMISNAHLIEQVKRNGDAFYFIYDKGYRWSIAKNTEDYYLNYYPGAHSLETLIAYNNHEMLSDYVAYTTKELKTKEALESFTELYQTVQSKLYGLDDILDQIINTAA